MEFNDYKKTIAACNLGYISQASSVSLPPILFTVFIRDIGIGVGTIGNLLVFSFAVQLVVDFIAVGFADMIGYRKTIVIAHGFIAAGMLCMGLLPGPFQLGVVGLSISIFLCSFGSGLMEVLISPVVDSLPGNNRSSRLSLLHSCYCWGMVITILFSTLALKLIFDELWWSIPVLWSILPLNNLFRFSKVPIVPSKSKHEKMKVRELMTDKFFLVALIVMACGGAAEQVVVQWSSYFAEAGLKVPKVMGDILGPCLFAALMGTGRVFQAKLLAKYQIINILLLGGGTCVLLYLSIVFAPIPIISLISCGLCGLAVSVMWPGLLSLASRRFPLGGTALFGILAISGDIGCASGTWLVGFLSSLIDLKTAFLISTLFPMMFFAGLLLFKINQKRNT